MVATTNVPVSLMVAFATGKYFAMSLKFESISIGISKVAKSQSISCLRVAQNWGDLAWKNVSGKLYASSSNLLIIHKAKTKEIHN